MSTFQAIPVLASLSLLGLRISLGLLFVNAGYPKLLGQHNGKGDLFREKWKREVGLPYSVYYLARLLELVGGIFLIVGLLTRVASFLFVALMAGILISQVTKPGLKTESPKLFNLVFLVICLVFLIAGGGVYSIDHMIGLA